MNLAWMLPGLVAIGGLAARWAAVECHARRLRAEISTLRRRTRDTVVNLPTRAEWEAAACTRFGTTASTRALVLIDLDRFKEVNDTCGHVAGDHALRIVAERLTAAFGDQAEIARLGGDEFGVIAAADAVPSALERFRTVMRTQPCDLNGIRVWLRCSIGIAWQAASLKEALSRADEQLYHDKSRAQSISIRT